MALLKIKGHEFNSVIAKDSYNRRAQQYKNKIITVLSRIGLTEDDVEIPLENIAIKRSPASASWFLEGYHLHYSYTAAGKFVDNLFVVAKVIELEIADLIEEKITFDKFIKEFSEDQDIAEQRKQARTTLGLSEDTLDLDLINVTYKKLAKDCHPDMPNGDIKRFKEINNAHKILKRELM